MSERIESKLRLRNSPLDVLSVRVVETMNAPTKARVMIACHHDPTFSEALAADATLELCVDGTTARTFALKLASARFLGVVMGSRRYELELCGPMWTLSLGTDTRKYRDMTVESIVSDVLKRFDVAHAWGTTRRTTSRPWCVQYHETNLAFVHRLLEHEGIYYVTDDEGVVRFGDASESVATVSGDGHYELVDESGALSHGEAIHALRRGARVASGAATVSDHDWKKPSVSLLRTARADRDAELETYDYPAGHRDPAEGATLARLRLEAHRATTRFIEGRGNVRSFAPARRFSFFGPAAESSPGDWVLTSVTHELDEAAFGGTARGYRNSFTAIPREVRYRPPLVTPRPKVAGCHTALVRGPSESEIHTDKHGRFKAQFHWDRGAKGTDADSRWMRMLQESATSMTLARVGWEVSVAYIAGNPDRPIGIARNINGVMTPTYAQPANKNMMTIRTPSSPSTGGYNELRLDDSAGVMRFEMRAEKDLVARVKHDKSERVGVNETHVVGGNFGHEVGHNQSVEIGADSTTEINGRAVVQVGHDRSVVVGASERVEIGEGATTSVKGNESERVASTRMTIAGGVGPPSAKSLAKAIVPQPRAALESAATGAIAGALSGGSLASGAAQGLTGLMPSADSLAALALHGSIARTAQKSVSRTVGGAFVSVAVGAFSTSAGLGYAETIGGAKISLAGGNLSRKAAAVITTVGGLILRSSGKALTRLAKTSSTNVGGLASFKSDAQATIKGASIVIEGDAALTVKVGGASIALDTSSVTIKGDLRMLASSKIVVKGALVDLTKD